MSYVTAYYHIVFSTHERRPTLTPSAQNDLYNVLASMIRKHKCEAYNINGTSDHVHILLHLHPDVALSALMRDIKSNTSKWMKQCGKFPYWNGWGREYGAFSLSASHKKAVYDYIAGQKEHHAAIELSDEMTQLVTRNGLAFYGW